MHFSKTYALGDELSLRNGKYVLSSGKDSLVKLWELSTSRCLIAYTGAGSTGKQVNKSIGKLLLSDT